jgi:hypothetical protein
MSRVSNDRLQELIEWYADDCNAYTEQHDRDIQRALTELLNLRLADQPADVLCGYKGECFLPEGHDSDHQYTSDQQSVSPTGDKGTIQPDDDISMQDAPQPVEGTGKQSMQACTRNEAGLVQPCQHEPSRAAEWHCRKCGAQL